MNIHYWCRRDLNKMLSQMRMLIRSSLISPVKKLTIIFLHSKKKHQSLLCGFFSCSPWNKRRWKVSPKESFFYLEEKDLACCNTRGDARHAKLTPQKNSNTLKNHQLDLSASSVQKTNNETLSFTLSKGYWSTGMHPKTKI